MDRCLSPKGNLSAVSSRSAAQPAVWGTAAVPTVEVKIECVRDVQRWLATVNVSSGNPEVGSVREAIAVLTRARGPKTEDVQPLFRQWGVEQRKQNKKTPWADTIWEF